MEELRDDDLRLLGPYVVLAGLTPAGGEARLLARAPAGDGLVEITLVRDDDIHAATAALRVAGGPGLPEPLDDGTAARPPWLAWRYVPALTLAEAGALMYGGLPRATVRALGARLAATLARLHAQGVPHGALTPDAVLVTPDGPRLVRPRRTGSPRDDIAALGALLTHAGAGRAPDEPLLRRCAHEDPQERPTAEELARELKDEPFELPARLVGALARQADRALALESAADSPPPPLPSRPARRTLLTAAGAGLLLGAGGVAGWVAGRGGTKALTAPAAASRRTTPAASRVRGTAPAALWRYDARDEFLDQHNGVLFHTGDSEIVYLVEFPDLVALSLADGRPVWRRGGVETREGLLPGEPGTLVLARPSQFLGVSEQDGSQTWAGRLGLTGLTYGGLYGTSRRHGHIYYGATGTENIAPGTTPRTYLIAYDIAGRGEKWRLRVPAAEKGAIYPLFGKDDLHVMYAADGALNIADVDGRTGTMSRPVRHTWTAPGTKAAASLVTGLLYSFGNGRLAAAPLRENRRLWEANLSNTGATVPPEINQPYVARIPRLGQVLYTSDQNRTVYALDPATGRELWRRTLLPDPPYALVRTAPAVSVTKSGRTLMVTGRAYGATALDPATGAVKWTFQNNQSAASHYKVHLVDDTALIVNGPVVFAVPAG